MTAIAAPMLQRNVVLPIVGLKNIDPAANRQTTQFMNLHGLVTLDGFMRIEPHQAKDLVKDFQSRYPNQGLCILVQNNSTGLIWWACNRKHQGFPLEAALMNADVLHNGLTTYKKCTQNKEKGNNIKSLPMYNKKADFDDWDKRVQETPTL